MTPFQTPSSPYGIAETEKGAASTDPLDAYEILYTRERFKT